MSDEIKTWYLGHLFNSDERDAVINSAAKFIKRIKATDKTLVGRGASGIVPTSIIAHKLKAKMAFVRKGEYTHSFYKLWEGYQSNDIIIIDDFHASGASIDAIFENYSKPASGELETTREVKVSGIIYLAGCSDKMKGYIQMSKKYNCWVFPVKYESGYIFNNGLILNRLEFYRRMRATNPTVSS